MTDTTDWPAIPGMYTGRYILKDRHLYCQLCGTPHLPPTAIYVFAAPPTPDELRGHLHMHEIRHADSAVTPGPDLNAIDMRLGELREHVGNSIQALHALIIQTAPACATCLHEERTATRPGHNLANTVIDGTAYCNEHLDHAGGRLVPRKSSGLIITGA